MTVHKVFILRVKCRRVCKYGTGGYVNEPRGERERDIQTDKTRRKKSTKVDELPLPLLTLLHDLARYYPHACLETLQDRPRLSGWLCHTQLHIVS